ncbi:MAG: Aspartate aminotransferase, partial [uncultured Corynebacteriales bacterium]
GNTGVGPDRRDRGVGHAGRGREGQGAEGGRPAGDRLRCRGAGLPHPGADRRGRRGRLRRPAQPPVLPRRRAARAARGDRGGDAARLRAGRAGRPGAGHQRRQAGGPPGVRHPARPGRRGAAAGAVLDDLSGGDRAGRRRAGAGADRRGHRLPGHRAGPGGGPDAAHQGAAVLLAVQPDRCRAPARAGRGDRPLGGRARDLGGHRRDLPAPRLRRRPARLDAGRGARAGRAVRRPERGREDVRDDRLAGRLDDRPGRHHQGRHQPAVPPEQQRRQRLPAGRAGRGERRPDGRARHAGGLRPAAADDRVDAAGDPRRRVPGAVRRLLRLPLGARAARPAAERADRRHQRGAGRTHPGGGRGGGGAGRGVRHPGSPSAVVRAGRRRPGRGRAPDPGPGRRL